MNVQPTLGNLCKRLLAALSLVVAATLAASAVEAVGRPGAERAKVDAALVLDPDRFSEVERLLDTAAGDPRAEAYAGISRPYDPILWAEGPRLRHDGPGVPATHAARAGLTRAPPPA